ncbi:MAG TPA: rhamnulokinase family protein [Propionibacteriaceae bacterium]
MTHTSPTAFAAADLGASSGRVILGVLTDGRIELSQTARFVTPSVSITRDGVDELHWDFDTLIASVAQGFDVAQNSGIEISSVAIDTWGVDYGRVRADGTLLEDPFNYRDSRTDGIPEKLFADIPAARIYSRCGLQVMPFNTVFQLVAGAGQPGWDLTEQVLLLPDLIGHWFTGVGVAEVTIASTTGLLDVATRRWSAETIADVSRLYGLPLERVLPALVEPGTVGAPALRLAKPVPVISVGGHDTASAVVTVPTTTDRFAYISSGTWSLVGLELDAPVLTEESRQLNFTNELGLDGTVRYLKNVMGLWVFSESIRTWEKTTPAVPLTDRCTAAGKLPPLACVVDMNDERLLPPGDMPGRLAAMATETGQAVPRTQDEYARCIIDSLALTYRVAIRDACHMAGRDIEVIHIVGGGSQNELLCQLTAEATGLPVVAGPVEGTAMGNLLVQARATGALSGGLAELRQVARASSELKRYTPGVLGISQQQCADAERRAFAR